MLCSSRTGIKKKWKTNICVWIQSYSTFTYIRIVDIRIIIRHVFVEIIIIQPCWYQYRNNNNYYYYTYHSLIKIDLDVFTAVYYAVVSTAFFRNVRQLKTYKYTGILVSFLFLYVRNLCAMPAAHGFSSVFNTALIGTQVIV